MSTVNSKRSFASEIEEIRLLVRKGRHPEATRRLHSIPLAQVPRQEAVLISDLARRLHAPNIILRLLQPLVRGTETELADPTHLEISLYATALSRSGCFGEANELFQRLYPESLFASAQNQMLQWNYRSATALLEMHLAHKALSDYDRLVALVNLAACSIWRLNFKRGDQVLNEIEDLLRHTHDENRLVYGYSLQLRAEMFILDRDYKPARFFLDKAESVLSDTQSPYQFYNKSWRAISQLLENPSNEGDHRFFESVMAESGRRGEWETYRELNFYKALAMADQTKFFDVYFGSPHFGFRKIIADIFRPKHTHPSWISWIPNHAGGDSEKEHLNLSRLTQEAPPSKLIERLLEILCQDFFRPIPLGMIISQLYPEEYFNPISSPMKAHRLIARLREYLDKLGIPLKVRALDQGFRLEGKRPVLVQLSLAKLSKSPYGNSMATLRQEFSDRIFTAVEASQLLGTSVRSTQRILRQAQRERRIIQTAKGRSCRYRARL